MSNVIINPYRFSLPPPDLTPELKAYWKFDEVSGNIINQAAAVGSSDSLGTGADMVNTGGDYGVSGIIDQAVDFVKANSDYATVGTSTSQFNFMHSTTAAWTLNIWLKFSTTTASWCCWSNNNTVGGNGFTLAYADATYNGMACIIWSGGQIVCNLDTSDTFIPDDGSWNMYTITYDQSLGSNNMKIYRNAANLEQQTKTAFTPTNGNARVAKLANWAATYNQYMDATVDEFAIWNKVLTMSDITALYNSGSGLAL